MPWLGLCVITITSIYHWGKKHNNWVMDYKPMAISLFKYKRKEETRLG